MSFSNRFPDITGYCLAEVIGEYLESERAVSFAAKVIQDGTEAGLCKGSGTAGIVSTQEHWKGRTIRAWTARRWLRKMGLPYHTVCKSVYVDGHEQADVVNYCNEIFLPQWTEYQCWMVVVKEDGIWEKPSTLREGEKPLVLVTHDESTFNANHGTRRMWMLNSMQPILPKTRGKGNIVLGFLTPGGILRVPDHVSDKVLDHSGQWPKDSEGRCVREAMQLLEYGKNNYWNGDKMVNQTMNIAVPIIQYTFPACQALFAFDNASNHCSFAENALVASKVNLNPGGQQPHMRDGFIHSKGLPQTMEFPLHHPDQALRGKQNGGEQILRQRNLWCERRSDGFKFRLQCLTTGGRRGCNEEGNCCMRTVLAAEPNFQAHKGRLEEELLSVHHCIIFYPKFHCELNFIEQFWCGTKFYSRENCQYTLEALRETVPAALHSISTATSNRHYHHCMHILDSYRNGFTYGTKEFKETVYKGHHQVVDMTKW